MSKVSIVVYYVASCSALESLERVLRDPLGTYDLESSQLFVFAGPRVLSEQEEAWILPYSVPDHQPSVTSHHSCPNLSHSESWMCLILF